MIRTRRKSTTAARAPLAAGLSVALGLAALLPAAPARATQFRKVLADTVRETDPTPSPDGKWLAFTMAKGGGVLTNIWVMPIGGGDARQLTNEPDSARAMTPSWSPDSRSLLFVSTRDKQYNVYSIPLEGGSAKRLTHGPGSHRFAVRSPDGAKIAFPSNRLDPTSLYGYNLFLMGSDGESSAQPARQITSLNGSPGHPTWSPDGKWIGFVSKDVDTTKTVTIGPGMTSKRNAIFATFRLFKVRADGGKPIQLTGLPPAEDRDEDVWPTWSPDGKWIAVARRVGAKNDVWLVDPESTRPPVQITKGGNCSKPTWSADGKEIWYTVSEKGKEDVWVASDLTIPPPPPPVKKAPTFKPLPATKRVPATSTPAKKGSTTKSRTGTTR
jgi:Tol biopolymer transport system component